MKNNPARIGRWIARLAAVAVGLVASQSFAAGTTYVSIVGDEFFINGRPTYQGRYWEGHKIQGLLMNARMVQGIFDDLNPDTRDRWSYPDTGEWDPGRNTEEFVMAMESWRSHGLLAFTLNLQGGSPEGYSRNQIWYNSAFDPSGELRPAYMNRLNAILRRADELGMTVILGLFYFGQDEQLLDEASIIRATDNAIRWVLSRGYRNVLIEVCNESNNNSYQHAILQPDRIHELIEFIRNTYVDGRRLMAGVSYPGGVLPGEQVLRQSDFILLHGNGVDQPEGIAEMVRKTRSKTGYRGQPIVFNEDDHFAFQQPTNHLVSAISEYASWGYFDYRMEGEGFDQGFQSVPVNWTISSERKRGFFNKIAAITGALPGQDTNLAEANDLKSEVSVLNSATEPQPEPEPVPAPGPEVASTTPAAPEPAAENQSSSSREEAMQAALDALRNNAPSGAPATSPAPSEPLSEQEYLKSLSASASVRGAINRPLGRVEISRTNYHGWADSVIMRNGVAEVIVVPAIGRIMQFRFTGWESPFWENEALKGVSPDPNADDWQNFGGDKSWPAPQSAWPVITDRSWPPPAGFDSKPATAVINRDYVTLIHPVDAHFGIRTYRMIYLDRERAEMRITTRYEKVHGEPVRVSVWTITQLKDPEGVFVPVPENTLFPSGHHLQSDRPPANLRYENGLISLTRAADHPAKIGSDASTMLWVGPRQMLEVHCRRLPDWTYPDRGSSAEVYTNADPLDYVELETLGPLQTLNLRDRMKATTTYRLIPRLSDDPERDARSVLGLVE